MNLTPFLFLRLLALVYLAAFVSFAIQAQGLIGAEGILPLAEYLAAAKAQLDHPYWVLPTLLWFNASDAAIVGLCWLGAAAAVALLAGLPARVLTVVLYVLYLSLFYAGQTFMAFQWDLLLLETGFIAIVLAWHAPSGVWLYRWLLFRFMFLSGWVKLASGDPTWADWSALQYHFETQPLPTALAWYAHHLPDQVLKFAVGATLFVELVISFLVFAPRRLRMVAAFAFVLLELTILVTGNYNFFNLLTIALCVFLFDDRDLARIVPGRLRERVRPAATSVPVKRIAVTLAALIAALGALSFWATAHRASLPAPALSVLRAVDPLHAANGYGLFAVMTTSRDEIVIEGTADGQTWRPYRFRYKPDALDEAPPWIIPHQPRLDWQLWFAALSNPQRQPWFIQFAAQLLVNSAPVTALLAHHPFPDQPPRAIRAQRYRYHFTTPEERAQTGHWWKREYVGPYLPSIALRLSVPELDPTEPIETPELQMNPDPPRMPELTPPAPENHPAPKSDFRAEAPDGS